MRPYLLILGYALTCLVGLLAVEGPALAETAHSAGQPAAPAESAVGPEFPDLSGEWFVQEEDKSYLATLDQHGNGPYSWQNGRFRTDSFEDRLWEGAWVQPGNDREGRFAVRLSEDYSEGQGIWWYTRVGHQGNIPSKQWGGAFTWTRTIGDGGAPPAVPAMPPQPSKTTVTLSEDTMVIAFGPTDLPAGHYGHMAASLPKHTFTVPRDLVITGYRAAVFKTDGTPLPREYLHHMLLLVPEKDSLTCPGEAYFIAGAGLELTEATFPPGHGVKLERGAKIMTVAAFYHDTPPTREVMATVTLDLAPRGASVQPLEAYHVGVNHGCYTKLREWYPDETEEGIKVPPGLLQRSTPIRFALDGCVKFAYPHGHDQLVLMSLENRTAGRTLLRTVPDAAPDGRFLGFPSHQVYSDPRGFPVNTKDAYAMTMVYHRPLQDSEERFGMANYILYMTKGACPAGQGNLGRHQQAEGQ